MSNLFYLKKVFMGCQLAAPFALIREIRVERST